MRFLFCVVDASVAGTGIHHYYNIGCPPLWHHQRWQNKKIHLLFSFLVRIMLFLHASGGTLIFVNNGTLENKCFNSKNQNQRAFVTPCKLHLHTNEACQTWCTHANLHAIINNYSCGIVVHTVHHKCLNGWAKLLREITPNYPLNC